MLILPSLNASNCGDILRVPMTIPSGNETAIRKTIGNWAIRSQVASKEVKGSSTKRSSLSLNGMAKLSRMGRVFLLVLVGFLFGILDTQVVQANMGTFRHNGQGQQYCQEEKSRDSHFYGENHRDRIKSLSIRQKGNKIDGRQNYHLIGGLLGLRFNTMPNNELLANSGDTLTGNAEGNPELTLDKRVSVTTVYEGRKARASLDSWETMRGSRNDYPPIQWVNKVTECDTIPTITVRKYVKGQKLGDWQNVDSAKVDMYINRSTVFEFSLNKLDLAQFLEKMGTC